MQTRKIGFIPGLLMGLMLLFILLNLGNNSAPTSDPSRGVMMDNQDQAATAIQYFDQTVVIFGSTFEPQYTNALPVELTDGSQWLLVYWWENHEIVNGQGIDWGFFTPVGGDGSVILLAKCHDPTWPNPIPGQTIYIYYVSEGLLKNPNDTTLQRFTPTSGVVNPLVPTAEPTPTGVPTTVVDAPTNIPGQGALSEDTNKSDPFRDVIWNIIGGIFLIVFVVGSWRFFKYLHR